GDEHQGRVFETLDGLRRDHHGAGEMIDADAGGAELLGPQQALPLAGRGAGGLVERVGHLGPRLHRARLLVDLGADPGEPAVAGRGSCPLRISSGTPRNWTTRANSSGSRLALPLKWTSRPRLMRRWRALKRRTLASRAAASASRRVASGTAPLLAPECSRSS